MTYVECCCVRAGVILEEIPSDSGVVKIRLGVGDEEGKEHSEQRWEAPRQHFASKTIV